MNKKNQVNKAAIPEDESLKRAWSYYKVGNFYSARALAKKILTKSDLVSSREQAASILTMCSADPLAVLAGFLVLLFTLIVAYVVAF